MSARVRTARVDQARRLRRRRRRRRFLLAGESARAERAARCGEPPAIAHRTETERLIAHAASSSSSLLSWCPPPQVCALSAPPLALMASVKSADATGGAGGWLGAMESALAAAGYEVPTCRYLSTDRLQGGGARALPPCTKTNLVHLRAVASARAFAHRRVPDPPRPRTHRRAPRPRACRRRPLRVARPRLTPHGSGRSPRVLLARHARPPQVFSVDESNSQLSLSACARPDGRWLLAAVADFPAACGGWPDAPPAPPSGGDAHACTPPFDTHGPPCGADADCLAPNNITGCLRCAGSGYCTGVPLAAVYVE